MTELRRTPLFELHRARGGRLVPFAGWELPVQYTGVVAEHRAVREAAGLFDVSHMGELVVAGPQAFEALQYVITNDLARIADGEALYTVMCREDGGIVDDVIVYREAHERYFVCVNAARREADFEHVSGATDGFDCEVSDVSEGYAQLALQGPAAFVILSQVTGVDAATMKPFSWVDTTVAGIDDVRVARTGYTGEDGVELYVAGARAVALWEALETAGAGHGLALCGLGCRDTLRLEVRYALYGHEIDLDHNPYEAALGWVVKLGKGDFLGRATLADVKERGPSRRLVGFEMVERGIPREGYPLSVDGEEVGVVTSGTHSPTLGKPIGMGYVPPPHAKAGSRLSVIIRGRPVAAEVVKGPFYKREG